MQIDYKFDDSSIVKAFKRLETLGKDTTPITRAIAAVLASESEDAFARETDPTTGKKWAPLTDSYKARLEKKARPVICSSAARADWRCHCLPNMMPSVPLSAPIKCMALSTNGAACRICPRPGSRSRA